MNESNVMWIAALVIFGIGSVWAFFKAGRQLLAEADLTKTMVEKGLSMEEMHQVLKMQTGRDPHGIFHPSEKVHPGLWYNSEFAKSLGNQNLSTECIAQLLDMFLPTQEWEKEPILDAFRSILENGKLGEESLIVVMERLTRRRLPETSPVKEELSPGTEAS